MSAHKLVVKHISGDAYKIQLPRENMVQTSLNPKPFWDVSSARQFIDSIIVTPEYWKNIINQCGALGQCQLNTPRDIERELSHLIIQKKVNFYPVRILDTVDNPPEKRAIKSSANITYRFEPTSTLLFNNVSETRLFDDIKNANDFLSSLNVNNDMLTTIANELGLDIPSTASVNPDEMISLISQSLVAGEIVIIVDKTSSVPPSEKESTISSNTNNKDAGLGTRSSDNEDKIEEKEEPPCELDWVSIQCKHGRDTGITNKTTVIPNLDVIATESKASGFDLITAEIHASELCASHKGTPFSVSKKHKLRSKTSTKIELSVSCDTWNVSNMFSRIWLPCVKPKTYTISVNNTCKTKDIKVKKIDVNVYPDMEWHWETKIDFGKLEFVPGKAKVKYSDFDISGNAILNYDGKEHDAMDKYNEYIKKPLDGFKKICDTISNVLEVINNTKSARMRIGTQAVKPEPENGEDNQDGNETRLILKWPKLDINYDSSLIENNSPFYVDHQYNITITAKPLLEIDIQVDVLDSLISLAPRPAKALIRYAKKRAEEEFKEDQKVGIRGEFDIIFTVVSTININESEISGQHNITNHDVEVAPVKGDIQIPTKLEGVLKAEGKWFYLSFKVHYEMTGEAEWAGQYEFGNDDEGVYFSNSFEFKGIDITLTKYEEVKAEIESDQSINDGFFDDAEIEVKSDDGNTELKLEEGNLKGETTLKAEEEKKWTWLKPRKDKNKKSPKKYYFVKR